VNNLAISANEFYANTPNYARLHPLIAKCLWFATGQHQNGPTLEQRRPKRSTVVRMCFLLPRVHCMNDVHRVRVLTYHFETRENSRI